MAEEPAPFFASSPEEPKETQTLEEEVDELTQVEVKKMKRASNLRNANGVDYAPWMKISADEEDKIRALETATE